MEYERRLLRHGFALYTLGLLTGLAAYSLANPRMGVAAHVEGVVNAIFLIVLAVAWPRVGLRRRAATWAYGTGFEASPWAETVLQISPIGGVVAALLCASLVLWALHRKAVA